MSNSTTCPEDPNRRAKDRADISLGSLIKRFWRRAILTWILVFLEGVSLVSLPMAIGWAVDDLIDGRYAGLYLLGGLCLLLLIFGAARRLYDTRAYGRIYTTVVQELVDQEQRHNKRVSTTTARVNLFTEFIDFLEGSIPGMIQEIIGLVGTLIIVAFISMKVLFACLICVLIAVIVYSISQNPIFKINKGANDEYEKQVDVLSRRVPKETHQHFVNLVRWRIRLSDLETLNYSLIWIALGAALLYTVVAVTSSGESSFGQIVSAVMYVFGFAECVMIFPLYYQQFVRLQEITVRLKDSSVTVPE